MKISTHRKLEDYSIEELESLAIDLDSKYQDLEKCLKRYGDIPSNADLRRVRNEPSLNDVLLERQRRLNDDFRFTPKRVVRFIKINDHLTESFEKAWNEARPIIRDLDQRIQNKDPFLKDYEVELKLKPYIDKPGIYELLEDIIHASPVELRHYCEKSYCSLQDLNWNEDVPLCHYSQLANYHIGYPMHELSNHSMWSLPDILKTIRIQMDVTITRQHFADIE
ncbi:hypothetical protein Ga0100231_001190 [Opitutaceae bacterium TAV4]|nr:hypothetical protein Ga0100230_011605 [Opitutaceae bacterium TAV3]RRK01449.1 hypothetical protein Ga0100231_001190 [Opitutaceae bacterium TAV4]